MAALCYAKNEKRGCYTGIYKNISSTNSFNASEFLAAHALPGPDSVIYCIKQLSGPEGDTERMTLRKDTPLSLIPGLRYNEKLVSFPQFPNTWAEEHFSRAVVKSIKIE